MRDKNEKLFSHRYVVEKISSNLMALSHSSRYSFLSDIQNCDHGKSLCLDINVVLQESSISDSFSTALRWHTLISPAKELTIQKFPFRGSAFSGKYWPKLMASSFKC